MADDFTYPPSAEEIQQAFDARFRALGLDKAHPSSLEPRIIGPMEPDDPGVDHVLSAKVHEAMVEAVKNLPPFNPITYPERIYDGKKARIAARKRVIDEHHANKMAEPPFRRKEGGEGNT